MSILNKISVKSENLYNLLPTYPLHQPGFIRTEHPVLLHPELDFFASGSGLEPFISPEAAELQLNRVASTRGVPPEKVRKLVSAHFVRGGILGENVVNVMTLNAALDTLFPMSGM